MASTWLTALAGLAGTVVAGPAGGAAAAAAVGSLGGGGGGECPGSPSLNEIAQSFRAGTPDRKARLEQIWISVHPGQSFPWNAPATFQAAVMGGKDCTAKSANGQTLRAEGLAYVREFGAGAAGSPASSAWSNPIDPAAAYDNVPHYSTAGAPPSSSTNLLLMVAGGIALLVVALLILRRKG